MGKNIKDFNSWQKLNEETFLNWASQLFTGGEAEPKDEPVSKEDEPDNKEKNNTLKKITGAVTSLAGTVASAVGLTDDKTKSSETSDKTKSFKKTGDKIPVEYVASIEAAMARHGITNEYSRKAILGVISKESPDLRPEVDYSKTSNERIRQVFGSRVAELSDSQLDALKADSTKFWDRVYGPDDPTGSGAKYGNTAPGDGEKYRGRGFNGITFKSNYKNLQKIYDEIGKLKSSDLIDIIEDPEQLEDPDIAAEFAILYFIDRFKSKGKDLNDYSELDSAVKDYVQANSGWGSDITTGVKARGFAKALEYAEDIA